MMIFLNGVMERMRLALLGPPALAVLPALVLGAYWAGGETALILLTLFYPLCLAAIWAHGERASRAHGDGNLVDDQAGFEAVLDIAARSAVQSSRRTACILLDPDDFDDLLKRYGRDTTDAIMMQILARLRSVVRGRDRVCRIEDRLFAVCVAPVRQLDLGNALQLATRLQTTLQEPVIVGSAAIYVTASVGLVLDTALGMRTGVALMEAAQTARAEARRHGPSAMRAYSREMRPPAIVTGDSFARDASSALDNGQITPWFQPQVSTHTGAVTGFEALARWTHPERGLIAPAEFLPALEQTSRMERLGEVMLHGALGALKSWDAGGMGVPGIGVNFAPEELRNPKLVDRIGWELDRFELAPERLNVEILETVVAISPDDTVVRNIDGLARLGCRIDLDDFGTGHASISSIRRFVVQRLKIDRSFVMKVDRDPQQQRMISAILLMAERLGLDTLAEGVETAGEHAVLAQLGCGHVQGFGIGRPMPFEETIGWMKEYLGRLDSPPKIGRQAG